MGFFDGSNAHFYPNRGLEYYNVVKRGELDEKYKIGVQSVVSCYVFLAVGAMALIVLFFIIFS